jgi:hypothetical protein
MYCLFVNVWCTASTGCQPNCGYIYIILYLYLVNLFRMKITFPSNLFFYFVLGMTQVLNFLHSLLTSICCLVEPSYLLADSFFHAHKYVLLRIMSAADIALLKMLWPIQPFSLLLSSSILPFSPTAIHLLSYCFLIYIAVYPICPCKAIALYKTAYTLSTSK